MSTQAELQLLWEAMTEGFEDVEQAFRGVDQAMGEAERGGENLARANKEVEQSSRQATRAIKEQRTNVKGLVTSFAGVVTSGLALYGMYEKIRNAQVTLAASTKEVHETQITLMSYQNRLTKAIERYGETSEVVREIEERIAVQKELLAVKMDRERIAQEGVTKAWIYVAISLVPTMLTAYANLTVAYSVLTTAKVAENTATAIGVSLKTLGIGLAIAAAAAIAFLAWQTNEMAKAQQGLNEELGYTKTRTDEATLSMKDFVATTQEISPPEIPTFEAPTREPWSYERGEPLQPLTIVFQDAIVDDEEHARKYARIIRDEIEDEEGRPRLG